MPALVRARCVAVSGASHADRGAPAAAVRWREAGAADASRDSKGNRAEAPSTTTKHTSTAVWADGETQEHGRGNQFLEEWRLALVPDLGLSRTWERCDVGGVDADAAPPVGSPCLRLA